ncbi:GTPase IMAP family member 8 [Chanos chanos]|uniref:GTPase IMAP family member 8 n=1 Tax=Chanos chanos TaxID=29144 RepID=A0A6J2X0C0_CHACN|nr:GTPase IMAP family member 8-like [Chanos chanos]
MYKYQMKEVLNEKCTKKVLEYDSEGQYLSDLRIVLLGGRNAGKSSVGNIILDSEEFVSKERTTSLRRISEAHGRRLVVVDTPGWWCDFQERDSAELVKREVIYSVSLSLPGPHTFLLVIKAGSPFTEKRRRAAAEHLELLGEHVWSHTMVLFTKGEHLGRRTIEQHIEEGGKALRWLLDKCGNRSHVLNLQNGRDVSQITELLEKIDKLVRGKSDCYFEMKEEILWEVRERRRVVIEGAEWRLLRQQKQRAVLKGEFLPDIRIVLLGARSSGKSSSGSTILAIGGEKEFRAWGRTARCVVGACKVSGRQVTVVDTPGWWMNYFTHDTSAYDKREILRGMFLCPPGPHVFLLVVRMDRMFTETYRRAVQEHVELLGESIWTHTIVLFTFGDWLGDTTIEHYIEGEGKPLHWLVEQCGRRYHVLNNKNQVNGSQVTELLDKIEEMVAGNSSQLYNTDIKIFAEIEEKLKAEEERANEMHLRAQKQRESLKTFMGQIPIPTELGMILLGRRHSGKSSTADTIVGGEECETGGQVTCPVVRKVKINGKMVTVVDMPGWESAHPMSSKSKRQSLTDCASFCASGNGVLLLVVNISSAFSDVDLEAATAHMRNFSDEVWQSTMVLFTNGDWLGDTTIEQRIESEGHALQTLVEKCRNRYHVLDNKNRDNGAQVRELLEKVEWIMMEEWLQNKIKGERIERISTKHNLEPGGASQMKGARRIGQNDGQTSPNVCEFDRSGECHTLQLKGTPEDPDQIVFPLESTENMGLFVRKTFLEGESAGAGPRTSVIMQLRNGEIWRRPNGGRPVVIINTSEWNQHICPGIPENFMGLNEMDGPFLGPHALFIVIPAEESVSKSRMLAESQGDTLQDQSLNQLPSIPSPTNKIREKVLKEFVQSGNLQDLIDQWGSSNIEELEAFIDSYFEMVWQDTMESARAEQNSMVPTGTIQDNRMVDIDPDVLTSIDQKLSKLEVLDEMKRDLHELRKSVEYSSQITQQLKASYREDNCPKMPSESLVAGEQQKDSTCNVSK